jgi:UDP-GlcNAc:undecaprenyl-phosphate GlcNAc-1-phosphate transferase
MVALRPIAMASGLVDSPSRRKAHAGTIPLTGGLAMYLGIVLGVSLLPGASLIEIFFLIACGTLLVVGLHDDVHRASPWLRLGVQVFAACVMVFGGGIEILDIGNPLGLGKIDLGPASLLFTILVTCTVINAFNFVDGIDGLAACLAIIAIGGVTLVSVGQVPASASLGALVCMSILGFLIFNFPLGWNARMRSFMGDSGSTMLGFVVVWLTTTISQGETRQISPVVGLWFAMIPLADFFTAFVRRLARGASPMRPDREHLHHILLHFGLSSPAVLNIMGLLALAYATIGVLGHYLSIPDPVMFAAWSYVMLFQYALIAVIGRVYQREQIIAGRTIAANPKD